MTAKDWWPGEFRQLVTIGDSITAGGWSTSRARCWASLLATMIGEYQSQPVELFNAGIGANAISPRSTCYATSSKPSASERLDRHVIAQNPDLLIIAYGLVDARGGTPVEVFAEELVAVVRRVREKIAPLIVLVGPYYMTEHGMKRGEAGWDHATRLILDRYNEAIAQIASREDCLFVDALDAFGEADWLIHYDHVHLNDIGHRVIANTVFNVLARNCSGLTRQTKEVEKTSPRWRDESGLQAAAQ